MAKYAVNFHHQPAELIEADYMEGQKDFAQFFVRQSGDKDKLVAIVTDFASIVKKHES